MTAARYWLIADSGLELLDHVIEYSHGGIGNSEVLTTAQKGRDNVGELRWALQGWMHHESRGYSTEAIARQAQQLKPYLAQVAGHFGVVDQPWVSAWIERSKGRAVAWETTRP